MIKDTSFEDGSTDEEKQKSLERFDISRFLGDKIKCENEETDKLCDRWVKRGYCSHKNYDSYMRKNCKSSCNLYLLTRKHSFAGVHCKILYLNYK